MEVDCFDCKTKKNVKKHEWKKSTLNGKLKTYICRDCFHFVEDRKCSICKQNIQIKVSDYRREQKKILCHACNLIRKDHEIKREYSEPQDHQNNRI